MFTSDSASISQFAGIGVEETIIQRLIPSGVAVAIAGGTMAVALSCCPSFAHPRSIITATPTIILNPLDHYHNAYHHPYHYDHYNNSYRVRHYVPKTNLYHHPYHHPYHY